MAVVDISSIVMSSRIRLARNLDKLPMPPRLSGENGFKVLKLVADSVSGLDDFKIYTIKSLPDIDAHVLQEKHLISKDLLDKKDFGAVILNTDETISIMVNEEDHIREQCFLRGLELERAYQMLNALDDKMLKKLNVAYSDDFGFLTTCITNLGTGMRASVMMFLPALTLSGQMDGIMNFLSSRGLVARGAYGEQSDSVGFMYQISNARSLGVSEKEIIGAVKEAVNQICEYENRARIKLVAEKEAEIKDRVFRAFGVLTNCFKLTTAEWFKLSGEVKMGIALGLLRFKDNAILDKLMVECMPNILTKINKAPTVELDRDIFRASFVANALKNQRIK